MIAIAKTLAVTLAGLLVAAMGFHHTGGPMTSQAASQIRAGDPPPCVYATNRKTCNDKLGECVGRTTQADCQVDPETDKERRCVHCTETSGQNDIINCVVDELEAWTLVCQTTVDLGACGKYTQMSICKWNGNEEDGNCECTLGFPLVPEVLCDSYTLQSWDENCTRRPR